VDRYVAGTGYESRDLRSIAHLYWRDRTLI
jgi:hypothetical protein